MDIFLFNTILTNSYLKINISNKRQATLNGTVTSDPIIGYQKFLDIHPRPYKIHTQKGYELSKKQYFLIKINP